MKRAIKAWWLRSAATIKVLLAYGYDARRFLQFSSTRGPFGSRENLAAKITERYHGIEKGLSLPHPRPGFGAATVASLVTLTDRYLAQHGEDHYTRAAIGALVAYRDFNGAVGTAFSSRRDIDRLASRHEHYPSGQSGVREATRAEVQHAVAPVGLDFFTARHSVREFADLPVSEEDLRFAEAAARTAPAVCNRQFTRVRTWVDRESIDRLLAIQGGARGFGEQVPALAMITVSVRSYWTAGERNQGWIDGGLFAMNYLMGLHARGLGAVPLNWSKEPRTDRRMRQEVSDLDEAEAIIMLIGFGHLPAHYRVAASPREPREYQASSEIR